MWLSTPLSLLSYSHSPLTHHQQHQKIDFKVIESDFASQSTTIYHILFGGRK